MNELCLYIMCGLPFAGKTTLAKEMVKQLGIERVSIDEINGERGVWNDETGMSPEEWTKTYEEAYKSFKGYLKHAKIEDYCYNRKGHLYVRKSQ